MNLSGITGGFSNQYGDVTVMVMGTTDVASFRPSTRVLLGPYDIARQWFLELGRTSEVVEPD